MKKKKGQQGLLCEHLEQVFAHRIGRRQWEFFLLTQAWESLVDKRAAVHIIPAWIRKDTLWVYVDGSGWMQEMTFMKPQLLCRINDFLSSVVIADIRGLQQPREKKSDTVQEYSLPEKEVDRRKEESFLQMTQTIGDPKCGQALFQLWLNFQKKI
jgi:hypothetical protein